MGFLESKLKPSLSRRARFYALFLQHCIDDPETQTYPPSPWFRAHAAVVLDMPLNEKSELFDDQVKVMEFDQYCEFVQFHLMFSKMLDSEDQFVKPVYPYPHPPIEVTFMRVTRLGRFYLRLPYALQVTMIFTMEKTSQLVSAWGRFKWIGSFIVLVLGFTGWNKTHQLSGLLVIGSTFGGLLATWIISTIASYFGAEHYENN